MVRRGVREPWQEGYGYYFVSSASRAHIIWRKDWVRSGVMFWAYGIAGIGMGHGCGFDLEDTDSEIASLLSQES